MHQLLLLRHAKSSWDDSSLPDRQRPLNARGRRSAAVMRRAMAERGLLPDIVLVSTARRTQETLDALEPFEEAPLIDRLDALYLASAEQMLAILREVPDTARSVLVIGHNPGMHDLALLLSAHPPSAAAKNDARHLASGFPTAALAEFAVAGPWSRLGRGGAQLVRFLTPRALEGDG
ncbi:MAG: histidine phosphatase family protein [Acetobacteraceae bacterium]